MKSHENCNEKTRLQWKSF